MVTYPNISREKYLPFSPPSITDAEIEAVVDALRSGWITRGPRTEAFEKRFAEFIGIPDGGTLALNSCTAGLHLALLALDIGPGDEVITTPMTFAATVNVIEHVGATPVLVDVEPDTLNIDPVGVAKVITEKTRVILPVHYTGHPVNMAPLQQLAQEHDLYIVEDAAHALPARYQGEMIGTIGDLTAFSFYATKNLTTGEGGMLTGAPELIDKARSLSLHGMDKNAWRRNDRSGSWYYEVVAAGYKYNMTDIQAALGGAQLARLTELQERRQAIWQAYDAAFSQWSAVETPTIRDDVEHSNHLYVLRLNLAHLVIDRAAFIKELDAHNIGSSVHFIPVHLHPYYRDRYGYKPEDFPVASREYERIISLPLYPDLTNGDVEDVITAVHDILEAHAC